MATVTTPAREVDVSETEEALLTAKQEFLSCLARDRMALQSGKWPYSDEISLSAAIEDVERAIEQAPAIISMLSHERDELARRVEQNERIRAAVRTSLDTPEVIVDQQSPVLCLVDSTDQRSPLVNAWFDAASEEDDKFVYGLEEPHPAYARLLVAQDKTTSLGHLTSTGQCGDVRIACCWPVTANEGFCLHVVGRVVTADSECGVGAWATAGDCRLHVLPVASQQTGRSLVSSWLSGAEYYNNAYDYIRTWVETHKVRVKTHSLFGSSKKTVKVQVTFEELYPDGRNVVEQPVAADVIVLNPSHLVLRVAPISNATSAYAAWRACVLSLSSPDYVVAANLSATATVASPLVGPLAGRCSAAVAVGDRAYESRLSRFDPSSMRRALGVRFADSRLEPAQLRRPYAAGAVVKQLAPMIIERSFEWPI